MSQCVQFVEDRVRLLESSPAFCLTPRNHCEEKREKFITRSIEGFTVTEVILVVEQTWQILQQMYGKNRDFDAR